MRGHPAYDRTSLYAVDTALKERNMVHQVADAERSFAEERYDECAQKCYEVLRGEVSEAIQAKCHMYLATEACGPEEATGRAYHACMAIQMWNIVIDRSGASRFPVERAKAQLVFTERLLEKAEVLVRAENEPLSADEAAREGF